MRPTISRLGRRDARSFVVVLIVSVCVLVGLWGKVPWWIGPAVVGGLVVAAVVQVNGRTTIRWFLDWYAYRSGMRARAEQRRQLADIRDVEVAAGVCGVRDTGTVLVAMIQLAPDLDLPTVVADDTLYTEDVVPVAALLPMLDQYGVEVGIDIVTTGQRIRPATSYSMLYDQLIGSQPVVGERMTWLVVRLDMERNLAVLARRGPCAVAGPKALASAAHRIANRLRERGTGAVVLPAEALRDATRLLHAGVELTDLRERWGALESSVPGRGVTSYSIDWDRVDDTGLDDCWTWNRGRTTLVVSLAGAAVGPRGLVRYVGPPANVSPPGYLRRLGGQQSTALLATLPGGIAPKDVPRGDTEGEPAASTILDEMAVTIGPNGQILGTISGQPQHALALPLFDPARYQPRRRTIDVHAELSVAQQIILRAMVVGADVEVHSARPDRWAQLVAAVGDSQSLRMAADAEHSAYGAAAAPTESATIEVFDQVPPRASSAQTTVTISDPDAPHKRSADLAIKQVTPTSVDVSIPMRTVRVDLIEPRGETRYYRSASAGSGPVTKDEVGSSQSGIPEALVPNDVMGR